MLARLIIRDIVLIERLELDFAAGLSALTGETGAGKSILLDAFSLALGGRGDGGLVRHGQDQGQVTAVFDLPLSHPAWGLARAADIEADGDLILKRTQSADGRSRAFINDQPVSVQTLRAIGATLVEIHGQHDDRALMDPATHRALLDAHAGLEGSAQDVAAAWKAWRRAQTALAAQEARISAARAEAEFLRHASDELTKLAPEAGEEADLAARRQRMMQAEKVARELSEAHQALSGPGSPLPELSSQARKLERRAALAPELLDPPLKALSAAMDALEEAAAALERALDAAAFEPRELEQCEERLFALRAAARKYNVPVDELSVLRDRQVADLAALDAGEGEVERLKGEVEACAARYHAAASALSAARRAAALELDNAVQAELAPLKLERARFITHVAGEPESAGEHGYDQVEFWVQTNPGTKPGPMFKVASGGELSRFMLALKVVLADRGSAPTLVFDEIDTGVGGAVADAIGERLARLGGRAQVVCVTHAPQVAAKATRHFLIAKEMVGGERVVTRVSALAEGDRREELARMLAGASITDEARAAATRLLAATR
jgi:DNA repair protein RecN (Recombination protein N)